MSIITKEFTVKDGIAVQTQNLREWKSILTDEAYKHLEQHVCNKNLSPNIKNGHGIFRGSDITNYVSNMMHRKYKTGSFTLC